MRHFYLSYIRILGVFFVVLSHSFAPYGAWNWIANGENSFFSISNKIIEPFVSMMPLLTFVSGYLFFTIRHKYTSFNYVIKKKFERLIVPMIFFGIVYYSLFEKNNDFGLHMVNTIFSGYGILWYCNMLFLCFAVAYPITKYVNSFYLELFILLVSFGLIYVGTPPILGVDYLTKLFFYFYFGFTFSKLVSKYDVLNNRTLIISLFISFIISYAIYEYNSIFEINNRLIKVLFGNVLRVSFILFIILYLRRNEIKLNYSKKIKFLDLNSFGCYVLHYPVLYFLYKTKLLDIDALWCFWFFPILAFIVAVSFAYLGSYYFRKTKVGTYLLG